MIKKILKDWNNRVGGNLNHKKESHLFELGSMLWEQGWSSEQIGELIKNLVEQETQFKGRTKKGDLRYFKSKDSLDKALEKGTVEPVEEPDKKDKPEKDPTKLSGKKDFERPTDKKEKPKPDYTIDINDSEEKIAAKTGGGKFVKTNVEEASNINKENSKLVLSRKRKGKGGTDVTQREELASISRKMAFQHPNDTQEEHKERVINHIREIYGDDKKEAERVIKQIDKPRKADNLIGPTLSGLNTMKVLKDKNNNFDMADEQPESYPLNVTFTAEATQMTQNLLITKLKEAKTEEEKAHYKEQLDAFQEKATSATGVEGDGDTAIIYEDSQGRTRLVYISNKKSMTDGHSNATVVSASEVLKKSAVPGANVQVISESIDDATKDALDVNKTYSEDARNILDKNEDNLDIGLLTKISETALTGRDFFKSSTSKYLDNSKKNKEVQTCLSNKGIKLEDATPQDVVDCSLKQVGKGKTTGMGDSTIQAPNKLLMKIARTTRKVREMVQSRLDKGDTLEEAIKFASEKKIGGSQSLTAEDCKAIYENEALKELEQNNSKRDRGMDSAHSGVQQRLESLDINYYTDIEGLSEEEAIEKAKTEAGPHERTVIRGLMKRMHWDKYTTGVDDDSKILEIGNFAVTPKIMRNCLGELSKWNGEGSLKEHLEKNIRIEPGTQRLVFSTDDGNVEIGNDTWRMAGDGSKITGSLGKDLISCIEKKVS